MAELTIGAEVRFKAKVFAEPYAPFYDAYKGHKFKILAWRNDWTHIELICISDSNVKVAGFVHPNELKLATDDATTAIARILTEDELQKFFAAFLRRNSRWRGANVEDILDELDNVDANLGFIEPLFEAHRCEIPEAKLLRAATNAAIYIYGAANVTWPKVHDLIVRARKEATV